MKHFIAKQRIDLSLPSSDQAWKIQQEVSQLYWREMTTILETVFDRFSSEEEWIQIPHLEIDLGDFRWKDLSHTQFLKQFEQALVQALQEQLKRPQQGDRIQAVFATDIQKWFYFLDVGYFDWHVNLPSGEWRAHVLATLASEMSAINQLRHLLEQSPIAKVRLIRQHDRHFLKTIIEVFSTQKQDDLIAFLEEWQTLTTLPLVEKTLFKTYQSDNFFWNTCLDYILEKKRKSTADAIIDAFLQKVIPLASQQTILKEQAIIQQQAPILLAGLKNKYKRIASAKKQDKESTKEVSDSTKLEDSATLQPSKKAIPEQTIKKQSPLDVTTKTGDASIVPTASESLIIPSTTTDFYTTKDEIDLKGKTIYIHNAGIVMVHPFLGRFFKGLGLVEEGAFCSEAAREQAIYLLHYMATGETVSPEYSLVLPKLLCGVPLNWPINQRVELPPEFLEEAEELLQAIIRHWKALGKVSSDSLRQGFLMREGKLEFTNTGQRLTIEKNTLDLLLDDLPWNISLFQLPWMEDLLGVDWGQ